MVDLIFNQETHQYFKGGVELPSVTRILSDMGFVNKTGYTPETAKRGSYVHKATELDDHGELDEASIDDIILPYLTAWRAFKRESGVIIREIEKPVCNDIYRYAGTLDRICELNGKEAIIDIKSGNIDKWVGLQLAAYAMAENKPNIQRYAVQLQADGKYKCCNFTDTNDRNIFIAAVACYHWQHNNKKGK
jgi:hypothetical protein